MKKLNILRGILTLFFVFLLSACGGSGGGSSTASGTVEIVTPDSLNNSGISGLMASVTIDGGSPVDLVIDTGAPITPLNSNLTAGQHVLVISYYVMHGGSETLLATVTKNITVVSGQVSQVTIAEVELLRNFDDDGDGFTNLAEILFETDPFNQFDLPPGGTPQYAVGHGSSGMTSSTSYTISAVAGEPVAGTATSTQFDTSVGYRWND